MNWLIRWLLAGAFFWLALPAFASTFVTVIYTGNQDGELEPCGCAIEGNLGGILRQATTIDRLRREQPELFFISSGGLLSPNVANGRITSEYLLTGAHALGYDALGVQWNDLALGVDLPAGARLPWVASNWRNETFAKFRDIRRGGVTLAFFSWLDPEASFHQAMQGQHAEVEGASEALARSLAAAKRTGKLTVLSTTLTAEEARKLLPLANVDVLLIKSRYEEFGEPRRLGKTVVLQPGSRGMRLGRVDLMLEKGRIATFRHQVISMPPEVPDAPRLNQWYADYNAAVKRDYQEKSALRKAQESGEGAFAGADTCKVCHVSAYEKWTTTKHADAFARLEDVNKSFDPACIQCHTVGFNKPGGYIDLDVTSHLGNVQCESCHGAARGHAASGGSAPVANKGWKPPAMCAQCHTQPHSPMFRFEEYWPRIAHGRDGQAPGRQ